MKLDPIYARRQYDTIKRVCSSNVPVFDKLVGKDSLSSVFRGVVNTLCVSATNVSTWKERVQYVLNNPDVSPGVDLIRETDHLRAHPTNPVECCADANPKTMLPNDT